MVYNTLDDFKTFLKSLFCIDDIKNRVYLHSDQIRFICKNPGSDFKIYGFEIVYDKNDETFNVGMCYNVIRCSFDKDFSIEFDNLSSIDECLSQIFEVLWKYTLCPECLHLIPSDQSLCKDCMCEKLMWDYGVQNNYVSQYEKCAICFENVYCSRLSCGHRFHKSCFINLNDQEWYDDTVTVSCPICRSEITSKDKYTYFFYGE